MDCLLGCLATLSMLVARIVPLEHSKKFGMAYNFIVHEFDGSGVHAIPT